MNAPRVIIVDDSALVREAMEYFLDSKCEIVGSVADGETAVTAVARLTPELVLLDISMPGINGFEAARRIKRSCPNTSIIFVSENKENSYIEAGFSAGASAYVVKSKLISELLPAIRSVLAGKEYGRVTA